MQQNSFSVCLNWQERNRFINKEVLNNGFKNQTVDVNSLANAINQGVAVVFAQMAADQQGYIQRGSTAFVGSEVFGIDIDNCEYVLDEQGKRVKDQNGEYLKKRVSEDRYFSLQQALSEPFIQTNALLVYTTVNHAEDHNRFRLVFRLPHYITDPAQYKQILLALIDKFDSDINCSDVCRIFYGSQGCNPLILDNTLSEQALQQVLSEYAQKKEMEAKTTTSKRDKSVPDFPKISLEQIDKMLACIKTKHPQLEYNEWLQLVGALYDRYTYDEVLPLLQRHYPEEQAGEYWEKYKNGLAQIPFYYFIAFAIKSGYTDPITYGEAPFVTIDKHGSIRFDLKLLLDFLYESGYRKLYLPQDTRYLFIRSVDNIVSQISSSIVKDYLRDYLTNAYENDQHRDAILNELFSGRFCTNDRLEYLLPPEKEFLRDTRSTVNLLLENGFMFFEHINGNVQYSFKEYSELSWLVWKSWIAPRTYSPPSNTSPSYPSRQAPIEHTHRPESGAFEQFVDHICACNPERIRALRSAVGYLLHGYKNQSEARAVVLCDEEISDNPQGGTGKSLLAKALGYVRSLAEEDGKAFDPEGQFRFQNVDTDTQIVLMDDLKRNFNFEALFHIITGAFEYECKRQKKVVIPYEQAPKLILTTNYTITGRGNSFKRRLAEYEIYPWYNEYHTPRDDFGAEFFTEWNSDEWNRFYDFLSICITDYLSNGLIIPNPQNLEYRKLQQATSTEFVEYMDSLFLTNNQLDHSRLGIQHLKPELFNNFLDDFPDYRLLHNQGRFSQKRFAMFVDCYAAFHKLKVDQGFAYRNGKNQRVISFIPSVNNGKTEG